MYSGSTSAISYLLNKSTKFCRTKCLSSNKSSFASKGTISFPFAAGYV